MLKINLPTLKGHNDHNISIIDLEFLKYCIDFPLRFTSYIGHHFNTNSLLILVMKQLSLTYYFI